MSRTEATVGTAAKKTFDADACAERYGFSSRHWVRLVNAGMAPPPKKFGRLVRWLVADLDAWEDNGCPASWGKPEGKRGSNAR